MPRSGRSAFLKSRKDAASFAVEIPSQIQYIRKVSARVLKSLEPYKIDEDSAFDIRLSVEEAVRNAIVHGNRSDSCLCVKVSWKIEAGTLDIQIEDEGRGFDQKAVKDPTAAENITRASGRGVFLIKKLMDRVEYNEAGNKVRIVKRLKRRKTWRLRWRRRAAQPSVTLTAR